MAVDDYLGILGAFAGLLAAQGALDVKSLERATGRTFTEDQRAAIATAQGNGYQHALIALGVKNPSFQKYLLQYSEEGFARVNAAHAGAPS